ncbi:hypothetical protein K458DRAFT_383170 [Lentithecium fluviatile CBS 122367]|uniref:Uncharacterized protein n=1 Tax=Lentithecium fluviatile CBS 122367 TaxID=1168545 RepID=A0A6G1JHJ4_9PLEO|nr:hypothetical protein K458DRAFT_383170 [Lentithecium fluviatile CBS 122367]
MEGVTRCSFTFATTLDIPGATCPLLSSGAATSPIHECPPSAFAAVLRSRCYSKSPPPVKPAGAQQTPLQPFPPNVGFLHVALSKLVVDEDPRCAPGKRPQPPFARMTLIPHRFTTMRTFNN